MMFLCAFADVFVVMETGQELIQVGVWD